MHHHFFYCMISDNNEEKKHIKKPSVKQMVLIQNQTKL